MNQTKKAGREKSQAERPTSTRKCGDVEVTVGMPLVKLSHYCKLTGDTPQAVHSRRKRQEWVDGQHCHLQKGRRLWIDLNEVSAWIRASR